MLQIVWSGKLKCFQEYHCHYVVAKLICIYSFYKVPYLFIRTIYNVEIIWIALENELKSNVNLTLPTSEIFIRESTQAVKYCHAEECKSHTLQFWFLKREVNTYQRIVHCCVLNVRVRPLLSLRLRTYVLNTLF